VRSGLAEGAELAVSGAFTLKSALESGELCGSRSLRKSAMKKLLEFCLQWRLLVFAFVVLVAAVGVPSATRSRSTRCPTSPTSRCRC
jgi:hypothetical protein